MTSRMDRRQALGALGTVSLGALLAACGEADDARTTATTTEGGAATVEPRPSSGGSLAGRFDDAASCRQAAEQTEGPYYFDADAIRSDIREDRDGARLRLGLRIRDADSCEPVHNAIVDVWHCDAGGVYSGFDEGEGERFLRGAQATDRDGIAEFTTIYPGPYPGRTVHIHAKVHLDRRTVLTTQFYFPDDVTDEVVARAPYEDGNREARNDGDGFFDESLLLSVEREGDGYIALLTLDVARA